MTTAQTNPKNKNPTKIVKVQIPMYHESGPALIYDQAREHTQQRPLGGLEIAMMQELPRGFFHAHWENERGWILIKRIPEQGW